MTDVEERAAVVARTLRETADAIEARFGLRVRVEESHVHTAEGRAHFSGHYPNGMHVCRCAIGRDHLHP
jgi:hypothetical protein